MLCRDILGISKSKFHCGQEETLSRQSLQDVCAIIYAFLVQIEEDDLRSAKAFFYLKIDLKRRGGCHYTINFLKVSKYLRRHLKTC